MADENSGIAGGDAIDDGKADVDLVGEGESGAAAVNVNEPEFDPKPEKPANFGFVDCCQKD